MRPGKTVRMVIQGGVTILAASVLLGQGISWASFNSASSASMTISSNTLAAPTSPAATNINCVVLSSVQVKVTWTASTSTWADGYVILRSTTNGSGYSQVGSVTGQATTSWTDTNVAFLTTYYYVVQSTKSNWRSVNSAQASVTTPTTLCV